ncbi:MAG: helix-turn-helix transcriptional regulator [Acetatifactor sp.]|nr:helix-turn-helix transcriptional regulator [Acetatifactor sp.]
MKLTTILKQLREENGLAQKEVAAILHVSNGTMSNYENGIHSPNLDTLCAIADYYGVSVDYLLGRTESPYTEKELEQCISGTYTVNDFLRLIRRLSEPGKKTLVTCVKSLEHLLDTLMQQKK